MINFPEYPSKPLSAAELYTLLAFVREDLHKYAIKARTANYSLNSLNLEYVQINRLIAKLENESFIEIASIESDGHAGQPRSIYSITEHGRIRLQEDVLRLQHALAIATSAGVLDNQTPIDIQRLWQSAHPSANINR